MDQEPCGCFFLTFAQNECWGISAVFKGVGGWGRVAGCLQVCAQTKEALFVVFLSPLFLYEWTMCPAWPAGHVSLLCISQLLHDFDYVFTLTAFILSLTISPYPHGHPGFTLSKTPPSRAHHKQPNILILPNSQFWRRVFVWKRWLFLTPDAAWLADYISSILFISHFQHLQGFFHLILQCTVLRYCCKPTLNSRIPLSVLHV